MDGGSPSSVAADKWYRVRQGAVADDGGGDEKPQKFKGIW